MVETGVGERLSSFCTFVFIMSTYYLAKQKNTLSKSLCRGEYEAQRMSKATALVSGGAEGGTSCLT